MIEKEPEKFDEEIPAKIPQFLSDYLEKMYKNMELGNLSHVLAQLFEVKDELMNLRKDTYNFETSPNLGLEWLLHKQPSAYRSHSLNSQK